MGIKEIFLSEILDKQCCDWSKRRPKKSSKKFNLMKIHLAVDETLLDLKFNCVKR